MTIRALQLGLPVWGMAEWVGSLYPRGTRPGEYLARYAEVFNAVEGNTTFYGVPDEQTVERWGRDTPPTFRFCFKFPQTITHQKGLWNVEADVAEFLGRMSPLGERLGPFMVQLPARFGPEGLSALGSFLESLPREHRYAVEVRHQALFGEGEPARRLGALLAEHEVDRVVLDTRGLLAGDRDHPDVKRAEHEKPSLPVEHELTGRSGFVRLIGHPDLEANEVWFAEWVTTVAAWIEAGRTPFVFVHAPSNVEAPRLARRFHGLLSERIDVGELPAWPDDEPRLRQLELL